MESVRPPACDPEIDLSVTLKDLSIPKMLLEERGVQRGEEGQVSPLQKTSQHLRHEGGDTQLQHTDHSGSRTLYRCFTV